MGYSPKRKATMKKIMLLFAGLSLSVACNQQVEEAENTSAESDTTTTKKAQPEPTLTLAWETDTQFTTNESVLYSPKERVLFVSCISGQPLDKDKKGFISKLNTDGSLKELKWAKGIDAPKGMAIFDGSLYVTNIDELVRINLESGKIEQRYKIAAAEFLNDVVVGNEQVYFSDMNTGRLHVLTDGGIKTLAENLSGLNGLAYANNNLYGLTETGLVEINTENGQTTMVNEQVTGGDGLVILDENTFLASRWQGEIWLIQNGVATQLLDSKGDNIQTADIGYFPEEKLVLVPRFFSNVVSAYTLNY
jgi:hypothetical protein